MNPRFVGLSILIAILLMMTTSCNLFTKPDKNRVAKPTFSPEGGAYEYGQSISIFCSTPGASIFYSVDGSAPTIPYTEPIILGNTSFTLKAVATRLEWSDSPVATSAYNIGRLPMPSFSPGHGIYSENQLVTISCETPGVTIRYSTDYSEPNESSQRYTSPITVSPGTTLKAVAFKTDWLPSDTATASYLDYHSLLVFVEGGTFSNGTSDVTLSSFYINKYEITQLEYQSIMGTNPSSFSGNPLNPVEQVSWFNAIEYCNRRSMQEGFTPCYSYSSYGTNPDNWPAGWNTSYTNHTNVSCNWTANGYRLPTEMEWEFAARGGNQSQGYTNSGSNYIDYVAWYYENSGYTTHAVGTKAANELGIYDMSGNVWEWCWDIYGTYPSGSQTNPYGASSGSTRVLRGGGCYSDADYCTVSYRSRSDATHTDIVIGFRCVRISP